MSLSDASMLDRIILRQLLDYDPATGIFTWLPREEVSRNEMAWNRRYAGKCAGRTKPNKCGYLELGISYKLYYCHRLAWLYMTGEWPKENVDHINGIKTDNRFENLREATVHQNAWNVHSVKSNKHGLPGVAFHRYCPDHPYSGSIQVKGKRISLGYFATPEEAHEAYMAATIKHHGEFARTA